MSVTTTARFNLDQLHAVLGVDTRIGVTGTDPTLAGSKTVTADGVDDATLQNAITTASGQFVDRTANQTTLQAKAQQALTANATFQAIGSPSNAQIAQQVQSLTKQCNGLIRLLLNALDSTTGT